MEGQLSLFPVLIDVSHLIFEQAGATLRLQVPRGSSLGMLLSLVHSLSL